MAYTINKFNGIPFITVEDGTIDTTTDLKLVGKNYTGYGEAQNENFIFLLENFSGTSQPPLPVTGQIWYDATSERIKVYNGAIWKATSGTELSATAPTGQAEGDLWWDTSTNQLKSLNSDNEWILIGPQAAGTGQTEMKSIELVENGTGTRFACIATYVGDQIISILSKDEFIPAVTQTDVDSWIAGDYPTIKSGMTIRKVDANGISVTDPTGEINYFWGTSSNALKLGGLESSAFLQGGASLNLLSTIVKFGDGGYTLGNDDDLIVTVKSGNQPNTQLVSNYMSWSDNLDAALYVMTNTAIYPSTTNTKTLGTATNLWSNIYATVFTGTATKADTVKENQSGSYRTADTTAAVNTIAVRDGSGNLTATVFNGTATKARYADLAEKYSTAEELAPGTAVAVCVCEDHEVEPANASNHCIGVVSTDPAIMMNSDAEGQYIALKGRVPVRVKGAVKKGQAVYAMADGVCTTLATTALVGVALESNAVESEKLVECVLKV